MNNNIDIPMYLLKQELPQSGNWIEPPFERKRHMPFGALAGSIIGIGAAVGVTVGATTALVISTIIVATTVIGLAMSVAGAVTGNKTLLKIGGIMSLAGGVAGLAVSGLSAAIDVGMFGAEAAASSTTAQAAAIAADSSSSVADVAAAASKADAAANLATPNAAVTADAGNLGKFVSSNPSLGSNALVNGGTHVSDLTGTGALNAGTGALNAGSSAVKTGGDIANVVKPVVETKSFLAETMDFVKSPGGVMLVGNMGKDLLGAPLAQKQNAQQLGLANQKLDIERADLLLRQQQGQQAIDLQNRQSQNLNTIGQGALGTVPLTPAQQAVTPAEVDAQKARNIMLKLNGK
jgi:hypothetical protein